MDSPQNNIDSVLGEHTTFYNSIITIGSIMAGNTAITQAPPPNDNPTLPPIQHHFFGFKIATILGWYGILCLSIAALTITLIVLFIKAITNTLAGFIIGVLLLTVVLIAVIWATVRSYQKRYPPPSHALEHHTHTTRKHGIKVFGIEMYLHYEHYEMRNHNLFLINHGIQICGIELLSEYTSQETKPHGSILCFFSIPLLRKTSQGSYLIGFIPLTVMIGLFLSTLLISSIVIYQQSTTPQQVNEQGVSPNPIIPIPPPPTPTIDVALQQNTPTTENASFYVVQYTNNAVDPTCFTVQLQGFNALNWFIIVNTLDIRGTFAGANKTKVCGLEPNQPITFTIFNGTGLAIQGFRDIPVRGGDTVDLTDLKRHEYALGLEAYMQQDWLLAAQSFNRVWELDPDYLDLKRLGSTTYFNWALKSLTSPESMKTSQDYLVEALRFNPNHHLATRLSATLNSYQTGEQALRDGNYTVAIEQLNQTLEQFHADQEFNALVSSLSVVEKLYQAYMLEAGTALELGDLEAAHEAYRQAILLKDQDIKLDVSEAEAGFSASKPKRLYFQKYADNAVDPTCFAVHIRGVTTGGWFVTVDGLGNRGNLDSAGNTNVCGLIASQEVTFTVYNAAGKAVLGGGGIPTRGGNLMSAELR